MPHSADLVVGEERPPLRLRGVSKRWPRRARPVLEGVDLTLPPGTVTWVGGGNGAGKTTLLRVACGLLAPDGGQVQVVGHDMARHPRAAKRRLGLLAAGNSGLYARLTARQQLDYWSRLAFVTPADRAAVLACTLEDFALGKLADRRLDRMSMGERQRVRMAMAFLHGPRVVLLDEPANSLDGAGLALLVDAVERLRAEGGAVLWCSPTAGLPGINPDAEVVVLDGRVAAA